LPCGGDSARGGLEKLNDAVVTRFLPRYNFGADYRTPAGGRRGQMICGEPTTDRHTAEHLPDARFTAIDRWARLDRTPAGGYVPDVRISELRSSAGPTHIQALRPRDDGT